MICSRADDVDVWMYAHLPMCSPSPDQDHQVQPPDCLVVVTKVAEGMRLRPRSVRIELGKVLVEAEI